MNLEEKESLETQVIALGIRGESETKISEIMGISRRQVRKIKASKPYKAALKEMADKSIEDAQNMIKSQLESMAPLALDAMRDLLKQKKAEGVKLYFEAVGLKDKKAEEKSDTSITVILPGAHTEKAIDVEVTNVEAKS